jgi:hypothetical protein
MNNDSRARLRVAANLLHGECGRLWCRHDRGFERTRTDVPCLLLDTRRCRQQLRHLSAAGMVHRSLDDDALHQG